MSTLERTTLWIVVISLAVWGVLLLLIPEFVWVTLGGSEGVSPAYSRYGGAWFLGVTVAAWGALRGGTPHRPVLLVAMVGGTLSAVALLVDLLADDLPTANDWIVWLAIIDAMLIGGLSSIALRRSDG